MPTPFLSSEEYDERAHQLYNEGQYDEALDVLREGLGLYPNSVELHIGVGYAHHAREDYAWARRSFEEALVLDPDHEDALAGLGETLLKFGQHENALRSFNHTLELGYQDDVELMLQIGRALFREGLIEESKQFFEIAAQQTPDAAEAVSCIGYAEHRLGNDETAISCTSRLRENPIAPVAQNAHCSAHPACDEMQSVIRLPSGMATVSIASLSRSLNRNFSVPSFEVCRAAIASRGMSKCSATFF